MNATETLTEPCGDVLGHIEVSRSKGNAIMFRAVSGEFSSPRVTCTPEMFLRPDADDIVGKVLRDLYALIPIAVDSPYLFDSCEDIAKCFESLTKALSEKGHR